MLDITLNPLWEDTDIRKLQGGVLEDNTPTVVIRKAARITSKTGAALAVYLPGYLTAHTTNPDIYAVLNSLKSENTTNRGSASGFKRDIKYQRSTNSTPISSATLGTMDPNPRSPFCRLTAWTARNFDKFQRLTPLFADIDAAFKTHVPYRYRKQAAAAASTAPDWVIPGTVFTTITVNNTYPTGVHKDKGDLETGFSTLAVLRRGRYTGGIFNLPAWGVGFDLQDGDLLLMDAHQWHGNTAIICGCGNSVIKNCADCGAERISLVSYFRTKLTACGTEAEELAKAEQKTLDISDINLDRATRRAN